MGCSQTCSETSSTAPHAHHSLGEWKAGASALLNRIFAQEKSEPWLSEVALCLSLWEEGDLDFRSAGRLEEFALLNHEAADLKYRQKNRHTLWGMLEADLGDNRNPIGCMLQTFSVSLARNTLEAAHDVAKNPADASFLLANVTAIILKMAYVLRETMSTYYSPIAGLLKARCEDVESLVLNCVVQGELYVLIQRLAQVLVARRTEMFRKSIKETDDEAVEDSVAKVRCLLQRFLLTESITEKRELLEEVEFAVFNAEVEASPRQLLITSFLALGLQSINSDLLITKLLTGSAPGFLYFLMDCVDAATSV